MSNKKTPLVLMEGNGKKPSEAVESMRVIMEELDVMIQYKEVEAKLLMAKYTALVKEGFTESQAIELCK